MSSAKPSGDQHMMIQDVVLATSAFLLCLALISEQIKSRRISRATWEELVSRLEPSSMIGITLVAVEYENPNLSEFHTLPEQRWNMIGGFQGVRQMWSNADLLIALAAHCEQWGSEESRTVGDLMRRDGVNLRRAARRIMLRAPLGRKNKVTGRHLQIAATAYHLLTTRLLDLYRVMPTGRFEVLSSIVWCPSNVS